MQVANYRPGLAGIVLVMTGYLGPWVAHKTAALTVTGIELAEFAKFFPQVQGGTATVTRWLLLTPVAASAIMFGLVVSKLTTSLTARLAGTGLAVLLALTALPPYGFYLAPEYRGQLILALGGAALALLTWLSPRLPRRIGGGLIALLAVAGAAPAFYQFSILRPLFTWLYDAPASLGWGAIVCAAGFVLLLIEGALIAAQSDQAYHRKR